MDIVDINQQITKEILNLRNATNELMVRAKDKANALGQYEKKLAQTMLTLKNGQTVLLDGKEEVYNTATGLEKIAKGVCYKESIALDLAESKYRNVQVYIKSCETVINALQSQLRVIKYEV